MRRIPVRWEAIRISPLPILPVKDPGERFPRDHYSVEIRNRQGKGINVSGTRNLVRCPHCGANNNIDPQRGIEHARCGRCHAPLASGGASSGPSEPIVVTDADFSERVINSRLPVLVDFWAPWCGPCRQVAPVLEDLAREYRGRVIVAKLNVDENGYTAREFRVSSIPTLVLIRDGNELNRMVGAQSRPHIERLLSMVV